MSMRTSITPGQVWLDTNGNRIQAHGGSIIEDGIFYWYGENKEKTTPAAATGTGACAATPPRTSTTGTTSG